MNRDTIKRFWSKVLKAGPDDCWIWTASNRSKGYGAFVWRDNSGKVIQGRAHVFSFEIHFGKPSKCVLHSCDNPPCVNPHHLFQGTKADNNRDMLMKGRHVRGGTHCGKIGGKYERGEDHHNARLTEATIRSIRRLKKRLSYSELSFRFGVAVGHLSRIVNRKAWAHVP